MTVVLGLFAATFTTISFFPQFLKVYKTKDVSSISLGMYSIFVAGTSMWLLYGLLVKDLPVFMANLITLVLSTSILIMKIRYDKL